MTDRSLAAALVLAGLLATATGAPAFAQSLDGRYSGASSIAGGTGKCWGNAPADAIVSAGTVTIRYVAYDGTDSPVVATIGKDGAFAASQTIQGGKTVTYAGKVNGRRVTANWKGPDCYGTLDLSR
ncbi:hypothetical protein [Prosthecomicrobium hirschii]|uniref:Uncharacterized protein n=1 Tax=Prosthecodimorpha hirschii TaxID=665126 RepID=A0A0P6W4Z9_9HYPH|nr:hypothetical protein [Prosthecomicrobium hirschii]KPL52375.1 hypothetical protein ABB55_09145 [Prosthecomicrobium hirschii]MCW1843219.1 hypothetical protein [Prosthecomicrobium hirschii]TPQ52346.1 hypothetical protein C2U72_03635 [Prosthecomicrobium hirschii]